MLFISGRSSLCLSPSFIGGCVNCCERSQTQLVQFIFCTYALHLYMSAEVVKHALFSPSSLLSRWISPFNFHYENKKLLSDLAAHVHSRAYCYHTRSIAKYPTSTCHASSVVLVHSWRLSRVFDYHPLVPRTVSYSAIALRLVQIHKGLSLPLLYPPRPSCTRASAAASWTAETTHGGSVSSPPPVLAYTYPFSDFFFWRMYIEPVQNERFWRE